MMDLTHHASRERDHITMRTMTVVRQYLAAAFFIVIGLIASGCGDSATVNPEVQLAGLEIGLQNGAATLNPAFNPATTNYTTDLTSDTQSVTVTAVPAVSGDSVTINGQAVTNRVVPLNEAGKTTVVNVIVSESNTSSKTYTVVINRAGITGNNSLQRLTVSPGTLPPPGFDPNTLTYAINVATSVETISVTPTLQDLTATMTVNGQAATSGQPSTVRLGVPGSNTRVDIIVTAQNNTPKIYTVNVNRGGLSGNNSLASLTVSPGPLNPSPFNANRQSYAVGVGSSVSTIRVTPTLQDPAATLTVTSNGQVTTSGQTRTITLRNAGLSTTINIVVRAQNGSEKPYVITVDRATPPPPSGNNNLSALTVRLNTSSPNLISFNPNTTSYTVDVGSGVSTIRVTPTLQDPAATLTVTSNGQIDTSGQARIITLRNAGLSTTINIVVRAPNGSQKPYVITVDRADPPPPSGNNNLSALNVSPGSLSPQPFSSSRTRYTLNVDSSVGNVTVNATPQDTGASVRILVNDVASGTNSISLPPGPSTTEIEVIVTALNGAEKSYFITANRAAPADPPPAPGAPDLISADDSCLFKFGVTEQNATGTNDDCEPDSGSNRDDEFTNKTTPRFRIPPPAGLTPSLYVDGNKVDSLFDEVNSTLRPIEPLSGNNNGVQHSITSTVTNTTTGLESDQSDPLEVTISTGQTGV